MNWISRLSEKIRLRSYVHELDMVIFPLTDARMLCRTTQWLDSVQSYFEPDFRRPIIYSIQETFYTFKSSNRTCFCIYCAGLPLFFYVNVLDGRVALVSFMTGYSKNTVERCSTLKGLLWMASRCFTLSCSSFTFIILKTATRIFSKTAPFVFHRQNKVTQV